MKNTFGNYLSLTLFGESHGEYIGAVIDGMTPGVKIDHDEIKSALQKRRPKGKIATSRVEEDEYKIISGEYRGYTTGTPLTVIIPNQNKKSGDYSDIENTPRPAHADYTAEMKYHGYQDKRGGGHFSGRITAALVAVGGIIRPMLEKKGVRIATHIAEYENISDRDFSNLDEDIKILKDREFPTLSTEVEEKIIALGEEVRSLGDSVGGVLETIVLGMPSGLGEPWFDTIEGLISHAVFSIPAIKGIEFGKGFELSKMRGSQANDAFEIINGEVYTKTNNNGGVNGGITNGMPITFRSAVKPTPSIAIEQDTVDLVKKENTKIKITGRHDSSIIQRVAPVVDAIVAFVMADVLIGRFGTDYFLD